MPRQVEEKKKRLKDLIAYTLGPTSDQEKERVMNRTKACRFKSTKHKRAHPKDRETIHKREKKSRRRATMEQLSTDLKEASRTRGPKPCTTLHPRKERHRLYPGRTGCRTT